MAVARVFGLVDGVEVILQKADEDRWNVPVPFDADGEYLYSRAATSKVYV